MSVRITHVRPSPPSANTHEAIADFHWTNEETGKSDSSTKATMVDWIDSKKGHAYVGGGANRADVGVVRPDGGPPYLRTYADGKCNNLRSLPRYERAVPRAIIGGPA